MKDLETMTKKELIKIITENQVLKYIDPVNPDAYLSISFAHVSMVENIGNAIADIPHAWQKIITAKIKKSTGSLTITIPNHE